jgi:hypothetical protein
VKRAAIAVAFLAAFALAVWLGGDDPHAAGATAAAVRADLVQGKGIEWWARHAVQARKDANARARTIRILRASLRARVDYAPRRTLSSATAGLTSAFLCIHDFEGSWADTRNPIYHGGLQMDLLFERTYGAEFLRAWGDAYNWPPFVQLAVAMRAYLSGRRFGPWPNTARACGLR